MGKRSTWVAWSMLLIFVVSVIVATTLSVANSNFHDDLANDAVLFLAFGGFMVVGALIVAAAPATPSAGSSRPSRCWRSRASWRWSTPTTLM